MGPLFVIRHTFKMLESKNSYLRGFYRLFGRRRRTTSAFNGQGYSCESSDERMCTSYFHSEHQLALLPIQYTDFARLTLVRAIYFNIIVIDQMYIFQVFVEYCLSCCHRGL
jgi:hypothetical protein